MSEQDTFSKEEILFGHYIINKAESFDFTNPYPDNDPVKLSNKLQMTVHENNWIALSAPQVGIPLRVFYIKGFESAFFNPKIVDQSETQVYMEEVSSTFPGLIVKIKRPEVIRIRWTNAKNDTNTNVYTGMTARVIQRKIDYLDGIHFTKRATKYHRDQALKRLRDK